MTDGNKYALDRMLKEQEAWDAEQEREELLKAALDDAREAEAHAAELEAKLAKVVEECARIAESHKPSAALLSDRYWRGVDEAAHSIAVEIYATLAELKGQDDED